MRNTFTTWKNVDGSVSSDVRSQLQKIKAADSPLIKNNAAELADALTDLVFACMGTGAQNLPSFGYAVHTLGKAGIKFNISSLERRKFRRLVF